VALAPHEGLAYSALAAELFDRRRRQDTATSDDELERAVESAARLMPRTSALALSSLWSPSEAWRAWPAFVAHCNSEPASRLTQGRPDAQAHEVWVVADHGAEAAGAGQESGEEHLDGEQVLCLLDAVCSAQERRRFVQRSIFGEVLAGIDGGCADCADKRDGTAPCVVQWRCSAGTLAHWGHAQVDGLWPFTAAFLKGKFDQCTSVYVLDLGIYMVPLLNASFPSLRIMPFNDVAQLPPSPRPITIVGHGMPRPFDPSVFDTADLRAVRLYTWLSCAREIEERKSRPSVLLIGRRRASQPSPAEPGAHGWPSWQQKCERDSMLDNAALRVYHSTSTNEVHYACGAAVTGGQKRHIVNAEAVEAALRDEFGRDFEVLHPEDMSPCGQVGAFALARVVLGQHGAALSNAVYMSEGAALLELHPVIHGVFEHTARAVGVRHVAVTDAEFGHLYVGEDRSDVTLRPGPLADAVRVAWRSARGARFAEQSE